MSDPRYWEESETVDYIANQTGPDEMSKAAENLTDIILDADIGNLNNILGSEHNIKGVPRA